MWLIELWFIATGLFVSYSWSLVQAEQEEVHNCALGLNFSLQPLKLGNKWSDFSWFWFAKCAVEWKKIQLLKIIHSITINRYVFFFFPGRTKTHLLVLIGHIRTRCDTVAPQWSETWLWTSLVHISTMCPWLRSFHMLTMCSSVHEWVFERDVPVKELIKPVQ